MDLLLESRVNILSEKFPLDEMNNDFQQWFTVALKWVSPIRLSNSREILQKLTNWNVWDLVWFLQGFTGKRILCWFVHEMWEKVIRVVWYWWEVSLSQFNCPMQDGNLACWHPELSWLAHAIFLAEKVLNLHKYRKWISLLSKIIRLDENVWDLPDSWRWHKQQILQEQQALFPVILSYIQN